MSGNELIVAFFALAFLAFCLTAVALYALSRDKDDIANKSVSGLNDLQFGGLFRPVKPAAPDGEEAQADKETE